MMKSAPVAKMDDLEPETAQRFAAPLHPSPSGLEMKQ